MLNFLFPKRLSAEETQDVKYCRDIIVAEIDKLVTGSAKVKDKLLPEILIPIVYLKIFSANLKLKKFRTLKEATIFMDSIKGTIDRVYYINNYIERVLKSMKEKAAASQEQKGKPELKISKEFSSSNID